MDNVNNVIETTTSSVSFANQQSIYRFGFKVAGNYITAKSFILSTSEGKLVRSRSYSGSGWASTWGLITVTPVTTPSDYFYYMSVLNENTSVDDTYTFNVVGSDNALYSGTKTVGSTNLGQGKFLSAKNITVSKKAFAPASGSIAQTDQVL